MRSLVLAEHESGFLTKGTLGTVAAALKRGAPTDMLILGADLPKVLGQAQNIGGLSRVLVCEAPLYENPTAEVYADVLVQLAPAYDAILAPASTYGKNIMPRAAALLDCPQISDVVAVQGPMTFTRPLYAGNILESVEVMTPKVVVTVRQAAFDPEPSQGEAVPSETVTLRPYSGPMVRFESRSARDPEKPDLTSARIVVSGGRALKSAANFCLIEELAETLGAAVGATRAAVDAGFVPNQYQVGQTGKTVAPDLYIAVGISGAIQHIAGMKDSKVIVAINSDPDAPIFQIATYGIVGDLFEIVPQLIKALKPAASPSETGGPKGPEPTRYGDWELKGRAIDF